MWTHLFVEHNAAQAIMVFSVCILLGLMLGRVKFGSISLGVGGVLFSGIAVGHLGFSIDKNILDFAREFGLILFVFSVGMQVGPSFLDSLKRSGLRLNLMAAFIVFFGTFIAACCFILFDVPLPVVVGLYSGAVTNTPSLAAATQMFAEVLPSADMVSAYIRQASLGYAAAYPFGIIGIIVSMLLVRAIFRVDIEKENAAVEEERTALLPHMDSITVEVTNEALVGQRLDFLQSFKAMNVVFSRIDQMKGTVTTPKPDTILTKGTLLLGVGDVEDLEKLITLVGRKADIDLRDVKGALDAVEMTVTKDVVAGKTLESLNLIVEKGIVPTAIIRAGVEFAAVPSSRLCFGDRVRLVSDSEGIYAARKALGDSVRMLEHPHVVPVFAAIFLGIILGSIPLYIPGLPSGVKLGLAGGPLLIAILFSRLHRVAGMVCFISPSASLMIREIGISLFLAAVGLHAGPGFVPMIMDGAGLYWMGMGAMITFIPLMTTALFACMVLKCNYPTVCGILAGSMTDPPALAFSTQMLGSDSSASVYATVYPLTMILRILSSQLLVAFLMYFMN